jgi:Gelsolin repeat
MILDSGAEIYVWIGAEASQEEKEKSFSFAKVNVLLRPRLLRASKGK